MTDKPRIKIVCGAEPMREGEYPTMWQVGSDGVTRIEFVTHNYGDHGIGMYAIYKGDVLYGDMMHRHVAEVYYFEDDPDDDPDP